MVSLAKPVNDGVVWFDSGGGCSNVTVGEVVSTTNVTGRLLPRGFPSELACVAIAVYCPLASAGLASPEVHAPPVPAAVALATIVPFAVAPS